MKCCPKDKTIKKEWTDGLERESNNISKDRVTEISDFSYVFSHPLRVKIAFLLIKGDLCVCEIVSILKEKQNLVSHHISIMKKYGVISSYHQSRYKYYTIDSAAADFLRTVERTAGFHRGQQTSRIFGDLLIDQSNAIGSLARIVQSDKELKSQVFRQKPFLHQRTTSFSW